MILTDGEIYFTSKQLKDMQWDVKIARSKKNYVLYFQCPWCTYHKLKDTIMTLLTKPLLCLNFIHDRALIRSSYNKTKKCTDVKIIYLHTICQNSIIF